MNSAGERDSAQARGPAAKSARGAQHHLLASVAVAQQAGWQHDRGEDEGVARGEPLQIRLGCLERARKRGQGDAQDREVEPDGEYGKHHSPERPPLSAARRCHGFHSGRLLQTDVSDSNYQLLETFVIWRRIVRVVTCIRERPQRLGLMRAEAADRERAHPRRSGADCRRSAGHSVRRSAPPQVANSALPEHRGKQGYSFVSEEDQT